MKTKAFTLIEALIVLAICAIIVAGILCGFIDYDDPKNPPNPYINPKQAELYWQRRAVEEQQESNRLLREQLIQTKPVEK